MMLGVLLLCASCLTAPGCLYVGGHAAIGARWSPEAVDQLLPGRTTKAEVLALLGPPNEYKRPEWTGAMLDDNERLSGALALARRAENAFTYQYDDVDADGTFLLLWTGVWTETQTDLLVIFFDERDVVSEVAVRDGSTRPGDRS